MSNKDRVIALGFFDGIHIGHSALLSEVSSVSAQYGFSPAVISFDIHPDNLVFGNDSRLLFDSDQKRELIKSIHGIEEIILLEFTEELMHMEWDCFLDYLLCEYAVKWIVIGYDFSFGYRGKGNAVLLEKYCLDHGIGCTVVPPVYLDGEVVSSTRIRKLISSGEIEKANDCLGHDYYISGTVVHGFQNGRKLGFPTANLAMPKELVIPRRGVYASTVLLENGTAVHAATNIGVRPTVCNGNMISVESYLLNFSGDLYGTVIRVYPRAFIRPEVHFSSFADLSNTINSDISAVEKYFAAIGEKEKSS